MEQVSEIELLRYRVAELESALGQDGQRHIYQKAFGLTPSECAFMSLLMKKEVVTREAYFSALYNDTPNAPCDHILNVMLTHIRKKLTPHGIKIGNTYGIGWHISPEHKKLVKELVA